MNGRRTLSGTKADKKVKDAASVASVDQDPLSNEYGALGEDDFLGTGKPAETRPLKSLTIGGLWSKRSTRTQKVFLSGSLGWVRISVFKNDKKERDDQPDYHIVLSERPAREKPKEAKDAAASEKLAEVS